MAVVLMLENYVLTSLEGYTASSSAVTYSSQKLPQTALDPWKFLKTLALRYFLLFAYRIVS